MEGLVSAYGAPVSTAVASLPAMLTTSLMTFKYTEDTAFKQDLYSRPHISLVSALANCGGFAMVVYLIFKIVLGPIVFGIFASEV